MSDLITFLWLAFSAPALIFAVINLRTALGDRNLARKISNHHHLARMIATDGDVFRYKLQVLVFVWWTAIGIAFGFFDLPDILGLAGLLGLVGTAGIWAYSGFHKSRETKVLDEIIRKEILAAAMVPEAVISIDQTSTILFANNTAHAMFGYPPDTLIGKSLTDLQPARYRSAHLDALRRYRESGKHSLDWNGIQGYGLHQNGAEFPIVIILNEDMVEGQRVFTGVVRPRTIEEE